MKIVYDNIVFSLQKSGGISVVWFEILKRMINEKSFELHYIEYQSAQKNIFRKQLKIQYGYTNWLLKYFIFIVRYLNPSLRKINEPFIFHSSYYRTTANKYATNITTVHDFIYEKFRHGIRKKIHCFQKRNALRNSDKIICVSENTRKDLFQYYPFIDSKNVFVIHNGVSNDYNMNEVVPINNFVFKELDYIIFVGVRNDYKRFDVAVEVAKQLRLNLVIVGGGELLKKEKSYLNEMLTPNCYFYFRNVSNSELNYLYNKAFCLIYPSSYEGFGIPVIEAQKSGCPVVAYNSGAVKEIIGNTPLLFSNYCINEISDLIKTHLFDTTIRNLIIENGIKNSENYSWDKTFNQLFELYNEILKK